MLNTDMGGSAVLEEQEAVKSKHTVKGLSGCHRLQWYRARLCTNRGGRIGIDRQNAWKIEFLQNSVDVAKTTVAGRF